MSPDSPQAVPRPPHPLALELIARLRSRPGATVLEIGSGSGRNARALEAAGLTVVDVQQKTIAAAALSTHALLHGTPSSIAAAVEDIAALVEPGGVLYATFGSARDERYGAGTKIEDRVFAPIDGDERGVPHTFFDESSLRALLDKHWIAERIEEVAVDEIAGQWAHQNRPLRGAVHWFTVSRRR